MITLFLIIAYLSFILLKSFLVSLFIGAIIAYTIYPIHRRLLGITKSERASAIILSLIAMTFIILLSALLIPEIITGVGGFYQSSAELIPKQFDELRMCSSESGGLKCRVVTYVLENVDEELLKNAGLTIAKNVTLFIEQGILAFFGNIPNLVLQLTIVLFSTSYFLHNGKAIVDRTLNVMPLKESHKSRIKKRVDNVIKAVIYGNMITAFIEGVILGLIFFLLGISMPVMWGLLVMFFALIPPLGAAIIWAPAVVILFILGEYTKALILAVLCVAIMGYIDNILRPKVISKKVRLSSLWILLGVLGGLSTFGFVGIFIGPLILALFVTFLSIVSEEFM
ncbi:MAG: AI-2E family transporter [Candidatus Altiarchaeota archaeon]|nr:AI-2E family transporter [Candidatus Altiarchaeota archaeon]